MVLGGELGEADHHAASVRAPVRSEETVETKECVNRMFYAFVCVIAARLMKYHQTLDLKFLEWLLKQFSGSQETKWYNMTSLISYTLLYSIVLYRRQ